MDNTQTVQPVAKFRHITENGHVVESFAPMKADIAAIKKIYRSVEHNCKMIRWDGKVIQFKNHYYEADLLADQQYLDQEIFLGHDRITHANPQEELEAQFLLRPKETMKEVVRKELEVELSEKIEAQLREKFKLPPMSQDASAEEKIAGTQTLVDRAAVKQSRGSTVTATADGETTGAKVSEPAPVDTSFRGSVSSTAQAAAARLAAQSGK